MKASETGSNKSIESFFAVDGGAGGLAGFWGCVLFRTLNRICAPRRGVRLTGIRRRLLLRFGLGTWESDKLLWGEWSALGAGVGLTVGLVLYFLQ